VRYQRVAERQLLEDFLLLSKRVVLGSETVLTQAVMEMMAVLAALRL
jgi:hypothetical protein